MKFLLALIALIVINKSLGYSAMLKSAPVTMVLALFCSFLPLNFIALLSVGVVLLHLYALSLESVIVAASVFFLMFDTDLIYAEVQAGYAKKDYGEINGRYEKNFTNYYTTGYNATDKKLQLISKYRADVYGIEFTARKSESETKDDKADEDVFVLQASSSGGTISYDNTNTIFSPAMCIDSNKSFIAALGNGKAITLTMTSSDGDNELSNISIVAGTALFTASKIEFKTDDMIIPEDCEGVLQFDHGGYRFKGYISKAEASYGRQSGVEYTLIVKSITKL